MRAAAASQQESRGCALQELCHALVDSKHFAFMGVSSCSEPPATAEAGAAAVETVGAAAGTVRQALQGGRAPSASPGLPVTAGGSAGSRGAGAGVQQRLLKNWCAPADKAATTGWASLSDEECMSRVEAGKAAAVARVREGRGTLLFKHVHKVGVREALPRVVTLCCDAPCCGLDPHGPVLCSCCHGGHFGPPSHPSTHPNPYIVCVLSQAGGSTLCKLAHRNMVAESAPLPQGSGERPDWDTNCVPYEAFLGPHPAVGLLRRVNVSRLAPVAVATDPAQQVQQRPRGGVAGAALEHCSLLPAQGGEAHPGAARENPGSQGGQAADPAHPLAGQVGLLMNAEHRRHVSSSSGGGDGSSSRGGGSGRGGSSGGSGGGGGNSAGLVAALQADAAHPSGGGRRLQAARWLGGACWLGFLTPAQLRVLPNHFRPLTFVASEGPLPDVLPLDLPFGMVSEKWRVVRGVRVWWWWVGGWWVGWWVVGA